MSSPKSTAGSAGRTEPIAMDSAAISNAGFVLTVAGVLFSRVCPCAAIDNVFGSSGG